MDSPGATDRLIEVYVEIPRGSRNKYELDKKTGHIRLDRVLYSSVHYPADYGFIPQTLGEDTDPLDVLLLVEEPTFPGCVVEARVVGVLEMSDEKGRDHKILAVPLGDPRLAHMTELDQVSPHWLLEIENFFQTYKRLEDKATEVVGWAPVPEALRVIREAYQRYAATSHHP